MASRYIASGHHYDDEAEADYWDALDRPEPADYYDLGPMPEHRGRPKPGVPVWPLDRDEDYDAWMRGEMDPWAADARRLRDGS